ncbi:MAG: hypothetical protein QXV69_02895 [Sulfolobaceae archaeon]
MSDLVMNLTAYDKIDELIKVAAEFPIRKLEEISLTEELLYIDQLPQLLKLLSVKKIKWNFNAKIIGPDGTVINTLGDDNDKTFLVKTPIKRIPIGWFIPKIKENEIKDMIYDLIPCKEGTSYFNPSMWQRLEVEKREGGKVNIINNLFKFSAGEITETPRKFEREEGIEINLYENGDLKLDTRMYNPTFYYLNPFFIGSTESLEFGRSNFFCISLDSTISIISNDPFFIEFRDGLAKAYGNLFLVIRSKSWKEIKPHLLTWDMRNKIIELDCKPPFRISLYKIEPPWAIPFYISYSTGKLRLGLINLSEYDMIFTFSIAGRITYAKVLNSAGNETENLNVEFDRVKIPIRMFGIVFVEIGVKRLLESFLRRKMIE